MVNNTKAILLCSGKGIRAGFSLPKQFMHLNDYPVIYYLIDTLLRCKFNVEIYLVILKEYESIIQSILTKYISAEKLKKIHIVFGGNTRQMSIKCANNYFYNESIDHDDQIFVIDGVRPLVTTKLLEDMYNLNKQYKVVGSYTDCVSTILVKEGDFLQKSLIRNTLAASHTPQIFKYSVFKKMYENINPYDIDNETECLNIALKYCDEKAYLFKTDQEQVMKITYKKDIAIAENIIKTRDRKVVLITGGSKGIGKEMARKLSNLDYHIIICSRTKDELKNTADELNIDYFVCDISDRKNVDDMFLYILQKYNQLDILINNAALSHHIQNIEDINNDTIMNTFNTNLFGSIYCIQQCMKHMKKNNKGVIITVGSSGIKDGRDGQSMYLASKNALKTISECISIEGKKHNVFSYYIVPRRTDTEMRNKMYPNEDKNSLLNKNDIINNIMFIITQNLPNFSGSTFWIK